MSKKNKPRILIVDDEPDGNARARKNEIGPRAFVQVIHPADLSDEEQVTRADLILIDQRLEKWSERDEVSSLCQKPMNGLALASVLRSHVDDDESVSPTGIAILSGHLEDFSKPLLPGPRAHAIARANNLEWAFAKKSSPGNPPLTEQILELASAIRQLPTSWPFDDPGETKKQFQSLLSLPQTMDWSTRAWREIESCYPPIHELSKWTHGLAVLRWLLHRILPYPCFLWDSHHLAARLRIQHSSLLALLDEKGKVSNALEKVRYKGVLCQFIGKRWWRSGIEAMLWEFTSGNSLDTLAIRKALSPTRKSNLGKSELDRSIVCVDENYQPMEGFCTSKKAVRLQPDDWPPYADQAWTTIELAQRIASLGALVIKQDRERLQ